MNAVNTAIYGTLNGDATLTALLYSATSIYHLQAEAGATLPYVVFNKQAGTLPNDTAHLVRDMVYQVRGFTKAGAKAALAIDARIETLLHGASLTVAGYAVLKVERIGDIEDASAEPNSDVVFSAGGLYRLRAERTS